MGKTVGIKGSFGEAGDNTLATCWPENKMLVGHHLNFLTRANFVAKPHVIQQLEPFLLKPLKGIALRQGRDCIVALRGGDTHP